MELITLEVHFVLLEDSLNYVSGNITGGMKQ